MTRFLLIGICCLVFLSCSDLAKSTDVNFSRIDNKQIVIIKADDLRFDNQNVVSDKWHRFFNYIENKNLKADIGVIGNSLAIGNNYYISYLKYLAKSENFELWNHGYLHLLNGKNDDGDKYHEFWNTSYQYQKEHLLLTQNMAKEKLEITFHGFGAPGNNIDSNTIKAIEDVPELKVWYFGNKSSEKFVLSVGAKIEDPTGKPNYEKFISDQRVNDDVLTLQIHPNQWSEKDFEEFQRIIDFLIDKEVTFLNGFEYYQLVDKNI